MEADVALRAAAGEAWSVPPVSGQAHYEPAAGRGKVKSKSAKGRGLPQPTTTASSPSGKQQRSRRRQQSGGQQQQQQQLRASRSLDDELDAVSSRDAGRVSGKPPSSASSSREQLDTQSAVALEQAHTPSPGARQGSTVGPGQQSPQISRTGTAGGSSSRMDKWAPPPKEQKKSSSRNRRRRAAAAAARRHEEAEAEVGELQGGEGMAQSPASPECGKVPGLGLQHSQQTGGGRVSRLPEPGSRRQEQRRPSADSLTDKSRARTHSQQSDDGFFSYEPDYGGADIGDQRLGKQDDISYVIPGFGSRQTNPVANPVLSSAPSNSSRPGGGVTSGFGYHGNGCDSGHSSRRRERGGIGRVVPKPSGHHEAVSFSSCDVPLDVGPGLEGKYMSGSTTRPAEVVAFPEPYDSEAYKHIYQKSLQDQYLADPHYGDGQSWSESGHAFVQANRGGTPSSSQGPNSAHRPNTLAQLSSTSSSPSSSSALPDATDREKLGSVVILEVKDRPGMYFKSSNKTLSDPPSSTQAHGDVHTRGQLSSQTSRSLGVAQPASGAPPQYQQFYPQSGGPSPGPSLPSHIYTCMPQHSLAPTLHPNVIPTIDPHLAPTFHPHLTPTLHPPTQLTYSPQMSQSPVMSSQPQIMTTDKTFPLDLSFSPRNNSPAHLASLSHPMSQLEPVPPLFAPEPAHSSSRSPAPPPHFTTTSLGLQSKLSGLRRPDLSSLDHAPSEESPLDLSLKNVSAVTSSSTAESSFNTPDTSARAIRFQADPALSSPMTPPPLDLRTGVTATNAVVQPCYQPAANSWLPSTVASTITEQPFGTQRGFIPPNTQVNNHGVHCLPSAPSTTPPPNTSPSQAIVTEPVSCQMDRHPISTPSSMDPTTATTSQISQPETPPTPTVSSTNVSTTTPATSTSKAATNATPAAPETETSGFLNTYEVLQQKAGVKHDDIVVGPRRPTSSIARTAALVGENGATAYNTFPPHHTRPGNMQAIEEDHKQHNDAVSVDDQPSDGLAAPETKQPGYLLQEKQSSSERAASSGSQTIPRRIPRKVQADSPQTARKKTSRLPKPMHGPSPERKISLETELSLLPLAIDNEDKLDDSSTQPLLKDTTVQRGEKQDHISKSSQISASSNEFGYTTDAPTKENLKSSSADGKAATRPRKAQANVELGSESDTVSASPSSGLGSAPRASDSRSYSSTKSGGVAGKNGLPQAVDPGSSTPPTRRKEVGSRLHMLSNIPVPMCHDPRPKQSKQRSIDKEEDEEDEASDRTPLLRHPDKDSGAADHVEMSHTDMKPQDSTSASFSTPTSTSQLPQTQQSTTFATTIASTASPSSATTLSSSPPAAAKTAGQHFDSQPQPQPHGEENLTRQTGAHPSESRGLQTQASSVLEKSFDISAETIIEEPEFHQVKSSKVQGKRTDVNNSADKLNSASDPASKPRLHRSVEQLGGQGQAKLSVFRSDSDSTSGGMPDSRPPTTAASVPSSPGVHAGNVKDIPHPTASSTSALLDSSSEAEKSPPIVKKKSNLPRIGILRRGSDRSAEVCRRGSEHRGITAGIPLSSRRHDPSVEDLKRATSISELCQSVASLLNIDNEKAAAMITGDLSTRQDLVDGLDADAIIDYLCHHGVLDTSALPEIDCKTSQSERNRALLRQVEGRGTTAVALFVNALRQSGQLHLASSLDTEQRIQPSASGGYFGKGRHKGEVTVRIEVEYLKILAPPDPRPDKNVDASLLADQLDGVVLEEDEDDMVKPRCWCFCRRSKAKGRKKKQQQQTTSPAPVSSADNSVERDGGEGVSKKQQKKVKDKGKKKKSSSSSSKQDQHQQQYQSARYSLVEPDGDQPDGNHPQGLGSDSGAVRLQQPTNGSTVSSTSSSRVNGSQGDGKSAPVPHQPPHSSRSNKRGRPHNTPVIMEYDPHLELVKLRAGQDELSSPTRQQPKKPHSHIPGATESSVGMLVEQWRSWGPHFQRKSMQLCARLVQAAREDLVKHFEQDRGTLVLDVVQDGAAVLVINICMMAAQVRCLQKDVADSEDGEGVGGRRDGSTAGGTGQAKHKYGVSALEEEEEETQGLLDKLQAILFSQVDIRDFDIRGIKLRLALDKQQVDAALSELS